MTSVDPARIHFLTDSEPPAGDYVLYWMQASVRSTFNPALEFAIAEANRLESPLVVCFGLTDDYPEASERHYRFLLEGLAAVSTALQRRNIKLVVRRGAPAEVAIDLAQRARAVVMDRGYLRQVRAWREQVTDAVEAPVTEVEGDLVVPVETASEKREYAARTIRPKIHRQLDRFLVASEPESVEHGSVDMPIEGEDVSDVDDVLASMTVDRSVPSVSHLHRGGMFEAQEALERFLTDRFGVYEQHRNQPQTDDTSFLSMYLHYGHISPVEIALQARASGASPSQIETFLEELIVRRELAFNYAWYEPDYDKYSALPEWARKTMDNHRNDERRHLYTRTELENAETHDRYWNAAMVEMREMGYMHNYMRMYWGKKILEWTGTPEYAFRTALYLNNKYLLDGRDPNSYTGVGWVFGLHDRPWQEREIFGTVRYMTAGGLERKADPEAYVGKIATRTGVDIEGGPAEKPRRKRKEGEQQTLLDT